MGKRKKKKRAAKKELVKKVKKQDKTQENKIKCAICRKFADKSSMHIPLVGNVDLGMFKCKNKHVLCYWCKHGCFIGGPVLTDAKVACCDKCDKSLFKCCLKKKLCRKCRK